MSSRLASSRVATSLQLACAACLCWLACLPAMAQQADVLGRPVAILRMGGRVPDLRAEADPEFLFGAPPAVHFPPRPLPRAHQGELLPNAPRDASNKRPAAVRPGALR